MTTSLSRGDRDSLLLALSLVALALPWAWVLHRILTFPENHVGFDPRLLGAAGLPALLVAVRAWARRRRLAGALLVALALASAGGFLWLDASDTLVAYERWLERGMPDRP